MKVYLQYPWKFPDSPYYKYLINSPPEGIEFLNTKRERGASSSKLKFKFTQKLKDFIKRTPEKFGVTIVNSHKSPTENYDLIHCAHCLSKNKNRPWVADLEMGGSLLISGFKNKNWQKKVRKYLNSPSCKKILPWTEFVKRRILKDFPEIEDKLEVVYPAVPERKITKKKNKQITFIYVARAFHLKGAIFALEIMKRLKKKYNIRPIVISSLPKEMKQKYPEIEIYNLMRQEKVFKLMRESDIFLYPSQMDTFGFAILEAMSFGLPPVVLETPGNDAVNEIIKNGKTGYAIKYKNPRGYLTRLSKEEEPLLKEIYEKCENLINDKSLRKRISKNCIKEISNGKFSIKERNKKLKSIYLEAIK